MPSLGRPPDPRASVAVLFGFSRYADRALPDLAPVAGSVSDLASLLTDPDIGGFAGENCLVESEDTSVGDFGIRFERAARAAEDVLLIYYCGHGIADLSPHTGPLYLAFPRTRPEHLQFTALALRDVKRVMADSPARNKILILDCCLSGQAHPAQSGAADLRDQVAAAGTYTLSSASGYGLSLAPPGAKHTAFTEALLRALESCAAQPDPVPLREVFDEITKLMEPHGLSLPAQSGLNTADRIALVRPRSPRPAWSQPPTTGSGSPAARPHGQGLPTPVVSSPSTWADKAVLDLVRLSLNDRTRTAEISRRLDELTSRLLAALDDTGEPPAPDATAGGLADELARRLARYERAAGPVLSVLAFGGRYGDPDHDRTWLRILDRVLNRRHPPAAAVRDPFTAAVRYPALLLVTALGTAAVAADRPGLAYQALTKVAYQPPGAEASTALQALMPMRVITPDIAANLRDWQYEPADLALSAHLRDQLCPSFDEILDDRDFRRCFASYEYLRNLLTVDATGIRLPGLYAEVASCASVAECCPDLTSLLRAGAFGGDRKRADQGRQRIEAWLDRV